MPKLDRILETALYVDDLARSCAFYERLFEFPTLFESPTLRAFDAGGATVLLLFQRGASLKTQQMPGGTIPPHDGSGPLHMCFAIPAEALAEWEQRLETHGIEVAGRTTWERGGTSLYFYDPDGHCLELATPGLWRTY